MRDRDIKTAKEFGVLERIEAFEKKLLETEYVVDVEFDLDCFWSDIRQVIFLPKYDIPVDLPNYYEVRRAMLDEVLNVANEFGLNTSGDRIEDYGEHFYIVRECDDSWVLQRSQDVDKNSSVKEWYMKTFPSDELGAEIDGETTFANVFDAPERVYGLLDVSDSLVRERVFSKLSELYGIDYDVIYDKWLEITPLSKAIAAAGRDVISKYDWTMPKFSQEEYVSYDDYKNDCLYVVHQRKDEIYNAVVERLIDAGAIMAGDASCFKEIDEAVCQQMLFNVFKNMDDETVNKDVSKDAHNEVDKLIDSATSRSKIQKNIENNSVEYER